MILAGPSLLNFDPRYHSVVVMALRTCGEDDAWWRGVLGRLHKPNVLMKMLVMAMAS